VVNDPTTLLQAFVDEYTPPAVVAVVSLLIGE
jgi:hypothetical protein